LNPIPYIEQSRKNLWIVLFVYISIFVNSYVFFKEPFEFYIGYLIYIVLLPGFIFRFGFNRALSFIFLILFINGVVNIWAGNDTAAQFFKVFLGLFLSYSFYYYVFNEVNFEVENLFKWYLKASYFAALLGLFQFVSYQIGFKAGYTFFGIFNKWGFAGGGLFGMRINSVFSEPTHLACVLAPAFFVSLYNLFNKQGYYLSKWQGIAIIAVYILSFSGLGQAGIFLTFLFLAISYGLVRYIIILIPVTILTFNVLYNNVKDFRFRLDGLTSLFSGEKFVQGTTHGSSFILYNNYTVALKNFQTNPLFGTGIGSHPVAFEKYSLAKDFKTFGFNFNGQDANSMFLRLMSETGLFGLGIFLIILVRCYVKRDKEHLTYHWLISNGVLVMILLNLFRQGHYFLNGFPFFVILYYYNKVSYLNYINDLKESDKEELPETISTT